MTAENAAEILNSLPKRIGDVISRWTKLVPDWPCLVKQLESGPTGSWLLHSTRHRRGSPSAACAAGIA